MNHHTSAWWNCCCGAKSFKVEHILSSTYLPDAPLAPTKASVYCSEPFGEDRTVQANLQTTSTYTLYTQASYRVLHRLHFFLRRRYLEKKVLTLHCFILFFHLLNNITNNSVVYRASSRLILYGHCGLASLSPLTSTRDSPIPRQHGDEPTRKPDPPYGHPALGQAHRQ